MNIFRPREPRHGRSGPGSLRCALLALPLGAMLGCSSASSGHAPGVAGGETLTPGITNYPLAYIKRPIPAKDIDVRDLITSVTGGDLYVRDTSSSAGAEVNVTGSITQGKGDVRDLDVSPDGMKLVFSLRLPLNPNKKNTDVTQPNWKIYQYDAGTKSVTQLTKDDITSGHDVGAHYLPDGRIVFSSTRQLATQSILIDEGRPQYQAQTDDRQQSIFLLHVMNADGTQMHQISFNTNHDFAPSVMNNGQIVFSRYEVTNGTDQISLYVTNPDGTGEQLLYGAASHATGANIAGTNDNVIQFLNARQLPGGQVVAIARPFLGTQQGGDILQINTANYVEIHQLTTPGIAGTPNTTTTPGQVSATGLGVTTDADMPSFGGRFASVYPLYDGTNRLLVSWSPCLVLDNTVTPAATQVCTTANTSGTNVTLAPPQYTLWIYDLSAGTLSPVLSADPGVMIVEPIILQARKPAPTYIPDSSPTAVAAVNLTAAEVGVLDISSVYDYDGVDTAKPSIPVLADPGQTPFYSRPARFIRVQKAVEIPGMTVRKIDNSAFGPAGMGMREILGYAPIEPDGSVQIQVPAYVPFTIDIVDANARRISAPHTSWLQLLPGETKSCNGCHAPASAATADQISHGRAGLTTAVNPGAPTTGLPFPDTNPALFANAGETMAQTRARITCPPAQNTAVTCSQRLTSDVIYTNVWTTGSTGLAAGQTDTAFSYTYADANQTAPTNPNCGVWSAQCRSTIHYANAATTAIPQLFLQSLWNNTNRTALVGGAMTSVTCTNCHNEISAANKVQVPSGQLDLTGGSSSVDTTVVTSYEQLLFAHDEQTLNMGALQDLLVPGAGGTLVPVVLPVTMSAGNANGSQVSFFSKFDGTDHGGTVDHTGFLNAAELRLISEWLDIGGQYYNDPFVAPVAN
jgi:hypothetical protein